MFEVGQRVFETHLKANGIVEAVQDGRITIRFNTQAGKKSPYRSVYGPKWLAEHPQSIIVTPLRNPSFHVSELAELEG